MNIKGKNFRTGVLVFVLIFPVFFVSLFYLRGKRNLGFDQKINSFEEETVLKGDTSFNHIRRHNYITCDNDTSVFEASGNIRIIGYFSNQSKAYSNQLSRIGEAYKRYGDVDIIVFDTLKKKFSDYPNIQGVCMINGVKENHVLNFNYPESIVIEETFSSFILLDKDGFVKGVYPGAEKDRVDDLLLETKVLLKKIEDEKR